MKTVTKPWGKEVWLELNDKYCYKRIYINSGTRTSYQYHNHKLETNYIIAGEAEVWLENNVGIVEKIQMKADDFFTVLPGRKHRVIAKTDIILQEVSTPEVDDVIRIQDDTARPDGKLESEHLTPAFCILTAGMGTRMGEYAKYLNKALLPIDNKAVISHIIEKVPKECNIVIALGYKGTQVREYCEAAHPDRSLTFVHVNDYTGNGTGPGHTLLQCKDYLQCPFYFTTSDCLFDGDLPKIGNWLGICPTSIPEIYSTVDVNDKNEIVAFCNKSKDGHSYAFTGLCAIESYHTFWSELQANIGASGEMVSAFYDVSKYDHIKGIKIKWHDIGTIDNYSKVSGTFSGVKLGIEKPTGQFIYKVGNRAIKIFQNSVDMLLERANHLNGLIPTIVYQGTNLFAYEWQDGQTLYSSVDKFDNFLDWLDSNLWKREEINLKDQCFDFYKNKTHQRLEAFLNRYNDQVYRDEFIINDKKYNSIDHYLDRIVWSDICETSIPTKLFHGDLQFDNVILTQDLKFKLIDWRESFGGQSTYGDVYYDLAKMYGGICMNYSLLKNEKNYKFFMNDNDVSYKFENEEISSVLSKKFQVWAERRGFDFGKIKKITALIFLNMAPLHDKNLDKLLYFHAITQLHDAYENDT